MLTLPLVMAQHHHFLFRLHEDPRQPDGFAILGLRPIFVLPIPWILQLTQ
jgi:hypothetical protein